MPALFASSTLRGSAGDVTNEVPVPLAVVADGLGITNPHTVTIHGTEFAAGAALTIRQTGRYLFTAADYPDVTPDFNTDGTGGAVFALSQSAYDGSPVAYVEFLANVYLIGRLYTSTGLVSENAYWGVSEHWIQTNTPASPPSDALTDYLYLAPPWPFVVWTLEAGTSVALFVEREPSDFSLSGGGLTVGITCTLATMTIKVTYLGTLGAEAPLNARTTIRTAVTAGQKIALRVNEAVTAEPDSTFLSLDP